MLSSCWPPAEVRRLAEEGVSLLGSWDDLQSGDFGGVPTTHLVHFVLDHATRTARAAPFLAGAAQLDHPQVCPGYEARPSRYVYTMMGAAGLPGGGAAQPVPTQSFVVVRADQIRVPLRPLASPRAL